MPVIEIDYLIRPQIVKKKLTAIYYPSVSIRMSTQHRIYPFIIDCLLDSGADYNLFPADYAKKLGIVVENGLKTEHMGIGNVGIIAYSHPVKLFLDSYSFKTEAHFSFDQKIPLLGRNGFFNYFKTISFNEKKKNLLLEY